LHWVCENGEGKRGQEGLAAGAAKFLNNTDAKTQSFWQGRLAEATGGSSAFHARPDLKFLLRLFAPSLLIFPHVR
jgi:hypothetical protein